MDKSPRNEDLIVQNSQGKSYEISPYQCSDDEDEDDELPTKKYIPPWSRCLLNSYGNVFHNFKRNSNACSLWTKRKLRIGSEIS